MEAGMAVYDGSGSPKPAVDPYQYKVNLMEYLSTVPVSHRMARYTPYTWELPPVKPKRGPGYRARQKAGRLRREAAMKARSRAVKAA
jgi:hypothetical protein